MFKRAINKDGKTVHIDDYPTREAAHADKPFTDTNHIGLKLTPVPNTSMLGPNWI